MFLDEGEGSDAEHSQKNYCNSHHTAIELTKLLGNGDVVLTLSGN